ncbi:MULTISPECIES: peptidoglycan-binding domain-containing protein [Streptomyces]|uniref:peptidoglycan-binding domain-containing protein n=1 Tax=Streptomyces TaxID=1883 RepID=UPI001CEC66F8|nr:peptidoglycan-binding domain-containing protein [Streptomyces triticiradicis]
MLFTKKAAAARRIVTVAALACATSLACGTPGHATSGAPYIRYGAQGENVKCVQRAVKWAGMGTVGDLVKVDGVWGPRTQDAVVEFQQRSQISADGIVGRETGQRMWNVITAESEGFDYCFKLLPTMTVWP